MTNQIVKTNENETNRLLTSQEESTFRYSPQQITEQVKAIQNMMSKAMKKDEHYGIIPGCGDKPCLLKPGAEKLAVMFRLAPNYEIRKQELPNNHREYEILCTLHHINSQQLWGGGIGCATTMESKYRYRWDSTGRQVPKEYWDSRDPELLGGHQFKARKIAKEWLIFQYKEHDNPADYYNTVLKMAKKRAFVDAILTATAASDCFTQDIEDNARNVAKGKEMEKNNKTDIRNYQSYQNGKTKSSSITKTKEIKDDFPTLITKVEKLVKEGKVTSAQMHEWLIKAKVESIDDLKTETLQAIVDKYEMPDVPF